MKYAIIVIAFFIGSHLFSQDLRLEFNIYQNIDKDTLPKKGRVFLVFSQEEPTGVFNGIQYPDLKMNPVFGADVFNWEANTSIHIKGEECYGFPVKHISDIAPGSWFVYAVFRIENNSSVSVGGLDFYSRPVSIRIEKISELQKFELTIDENRKNISWPENGKYFKYESISSSLLTKFWKTPMSVNCQVVLPRTYYINENKKFPLLIMIGGFGERFYNKVIKEKELLNPDMPQMIVVIMDSKAPFGDSYQVNSANNGPYGDALVNEVIPFLESRYRCQGTSESRFLAGTSTGGWSSLALQIFYPDYFNGVWSTCSDPVDFRQMELINIYEDDNAFINNYKVERPAMRDMNGEPRYTVRTEVWSENLMGQENAYTRSRGQWCSWNAVFSPKDVLTGFPKLIFDPETGKINKEVANTWKKYDLRWYLAENWNKIGHKLEGKLHIWMGTADSYYLNNAMVLLDRFLKSTSNPKSDAEVHFICGEGHACDSEIPLELMMKQMLERFEKSK